MRESTHWGRVVPPPPDYVDRRTVGARRRAGVTRSNARELSGPEPIRDAWNSPGRGRPAQPAVGWLSGGVYYAMA
jgi:hypothetical protein